MRVCLAFVYFFISLFCLLFIVYVFILGEQPSGLRHGIDESSAYFEAGKMKTSKLCLQSKGKKMSPSINQKIKKE